MGQLSCRIEEEGQVRRMALEIDATPSTWPCLSILRYILTRHVKYRPTTRESSSAYRRSDIFYPARLFVVVVYTERNTFETAPIGEWSEIHYAVINFEFAQRSGAAG